MSEIFAIIGVHEFSEHLIQLIFMKKTQVSPL